jgi:twitching motility protein PilT
MRQNPDIILIGEMRDLETVQAAITAAETGVLVFTTLHTPGAAETINRIVDFFPASHQRQIMAQLSSVLQGVISQRLVPALSKKGLVAICEILLCLPSVRTMIREGSVHQIQNIIETSSKQGMQSMDQVLLSLYNQKIIAKEELLLYIKDREREEVKDILSIKEEEGF